jgi:hypothetical protein
MTGIIERLRVNANEYGMEWLEEAAARIEQLEAALREVIADSFSVYAIEVARAALEEK